MRVRCPECDAGLRVTAEDDGRKIECPKCDHVFRCDFNDAGDDRPRRRSRRDDDRDEADAGGGSGKVLAIAGGSVAAAVAVGVIVWVVAGRPKADDQAKANPPAFKDNTAPVNPAPRPNPNPAPVVPLQPPVLTPPAVPNTPPTTPGNGLADANPNTPTPANPGSLTPAGAPAVPPELAGLGDLFRREVSSPLPTRRLGKLEKGTDETLNLEVPTFHSLKAARQAAAAPAKKTDKLTPAEVKKATAFIKVEAGEFSGSGSGFLVGMLGPTGLVATNHHVIESALKRPAPGAPPHKITVVFDSGLPGEYTMPASVTAIDPIADLAILRVQGRLPAKIIDPWATPKLTETLKVNIFGFPFGSQLATGGDHPNISVNPGTVSSLRTDRSGKLDQVQISGPINPGNSGGPITDEDGRLVGIAVATITGSGLGFAVPVNELIALMEGKLLATLFIPTKLEGGVARFKVVVPIMDPGGLVKTVYLRYWAGEGEKPKPVKDRLIGHKPIPQKPGTGQLNLSVGDGPTSLQLAVGDLELPSNATEVVLQLASETQAGFLAASPPVAFSLNVANQPTGTDAKPFADFAATLASNPDRLAGEVVVVRGKIMSPPGSRAPVQEVGVADVDGRRPSGVRFVADRETAAQFDEVESEHQTYDARITCVVGGRGADGRVAVRVARVDFLDEGDRPVKSIPGDSKDDKLAALNRDPARFAGQTVDVKAAAAPVQTRRIGPADELLVVFPNQRRPRNLRFVTTPGLTARLAEEKFKANGLYKVRLQSTVAAPATPDGQAQVTVRRIEILDPKDDTKVLKIIE